MRGRMNEGKSYAASQPLGEVMIGGTVGQVVESRHPRYAPGDWVVGMGGWQEYGVVDADQPGALRKVDAAAALAQELAPAKGVHPALDRLVASLPTRVEMMANEVEARRLAQGVALAVQAALLAQTAPGAVLRAFCDSRLAGDWGGSFGTLPGGTDFAAILERTRPR